MTTTSMLVQGILAEDVDSLRAQVWMHDNSNVLTTLTSGAHELSEALKSRIEKIQRLGKGREVLTGALESLTKALDERITLPKEADRHARVAKLLLHMSDDDWRAAKLARLFTAVGLQFHEAPSEAELNDLGVRCERSIVELLTKFDGPQQHKKDGYAPFTGDSITDVARYIWARMCHQFDRQYTAMAPEDRQKIATQLAEDLRNLSHENRKRIEREFNLADLSASTLLKATSISGIAVAAMGYVGIGGFAAYTGITSLIAAVSGLVGLAVPFAGYVAATSALAFLASPVALFGFGALSVKMTYNAKRDMRLRLAPVMATFAVTALTASEPPPGGAGRLANLFGAYYKELRDAARSRQAEIRRSFPCLPKSLSTS